MGCQCGSKKEKEGSAYKVLKSHWEKEALQLLQCDEAEVHGPEKGCSSPAFNYNKKESADFARRLKQDETEYRAQVRRRGPRICSREADLQSLLSEKFEEMESEN